MKRIIIGILMLCSADISAQIQQLPQWASRRSKLMLNIGMPAIPGSLDPTTLMFANHFLILQCTCQNLVRVGETGNIVGDAAESWHFTPDGKTIRFVLHEKLRFWDGSPVTVEDVHWSLSRHFEPTSASIVSGYLGRIIEPKSAFRSIDERTIQITMKHPYSPILHLLAMPGFCIQKTRSKPLIGSGPLKLVEISATAIRLARNNHYSGDVSMREVTIRPYPQLSQSNASLEWNDIDLALGVSPALAARLDDKDLVVKSMDSLATAHLYFNLEGRPDLDLPHRQLISALSQSVAQKFKSTFFEPIHHFFPKGVLPVQYYAPKPEAAKSTKLKRLKSRLKIKLLANIFPEEFAKELETTFAKSSIPVQVQRLAPPELLAAIRSHDYDLLGVSYILNFPDVDSALEPLDSRSPGQIGRFDTASFMKRLEQARQLSGNDKRLAAYSDVLRELEAEHFFIPLFRLRLPIVQRSSLVIPNTNYRYEAELWKVLWRE